MDRQIGLSDEAVQGIREVVKADNANDGRNRFQSLPLAVRDELVSCLPRKATPGPLVWEHFTETDEGLLVRISLDTGPRSRLEGRHSRLLPLRGPRAEEDLDSLLQRPPNPEEDMGWRLVVPRSQWRDEIDRAALDALQSSGMYAAAAFGEATFNRAIRRRFLVNRMYGGIPPAMLSDMWREWSDNHQKELASRPSSGGYGMESQRGRHLAVVKSDIHQDALHQTVRRFVQVESGEAHIYRVYRTEIADGQLVKVQYQCMPFGHSAPSREGSGRGRRRGGGSPSSRPRSLFHCPCYLVLSRRRADGYWTDQWTMFILGSHNHPETPVAKRPIHPAVEHKLNVMVENKAPATEIVYQCNAVGDLLEQMDKCEPGTALPNMAELLQTITPQDTTYVFHQWDCITPRVRGGKGYANNRTIPVPPSDAISPAMVMMRENGQFASPQQQQEQGAGSTGVSSSVGAGAASALSPVAHSGAAPSGALMTPPEAVSARMTSTSTASMGGGDGTHHEGSRLGLGLEEMPTSTTLEELSLQQGDSTRQPKLSRSEHEQRAAQVGLRRMYANVRYRIERRDVLNIRNYYHHRKVGTRSPSTPHSHEQVTYAPSGLAVSGPAAHSAASYHFTAASAATTAGSAGLSLGSPMSHYEAPSAGSAEAAVSPSLALGAPEGAGAEGASAGGQSYEQLVQLAQQFGGEVVAGGVMIPASSAALLGSWQGASNADPATSPGHHGTDDDHRDGEEEQEQEEEQEEEEYVRPPAKRPRRR